MTHLVNQSTPAGADDWFTPGRFLALLALCIFATFPEVILGSHTFYYRDFGHFTYPLVHFHRECFWRGEVPLWNPYNSCGLPHLAQWNTMCLYPGTLLYLLGPMPWAPGLFCLAHLLVAGAGAYRLAHHWTGNRFAASIGGLAFAFNGFTLHAVMWSNNIAALAWTPWLWLLAERAGREGGRTVLLAALLGAMQMLAGAPEVIWFTWLVAVPLALLEGKRQKAKGKCSEPPGAAAPTFSFAVPAFRLGAISALVAALSAAQLLPFLDLLRHSHRTFGFDNNLYAMPLWGWANFFVPLFGMSPDRNGVFTQLDQQWTSSYYPGIGVLALTTLAVWRRREPRVWLLAAFAVLGVWLAMGQNAFLLGWLKTVCPPLGFIRFPIKYVLLPLTVLPFLGAIGVARLRQESLLSGELTNQTGKEPMSARLPPLALITLGLLLLVGGIVCWAVFAQPVVLSSPAIANAFRALCLLAGIVVLLGNRMDAGTNTRRMARRLAILGLLAADIALHAPRQNPTVITQAYEPGVAKFPAAMPRLGEGRAMISLGMEGYMFRSSNPDALNYCIGARRALFANWNLLEHVPKPNGFFSLFPREPFDTWQLLYSSARPFPERFADFLGITRISSDETLFDWVRRTNALPLVTAGQQPLFTTATNTLRALADADFNPAHVVHLPQALRAFATVTNAAQARVLSTRFGTATARIEVEADSPAWVVIAQTYYPPWKAFIEGREVPIHRANHAFQALEIPAGRHLIELRYVDWSFRFGAVISLATLLGVIALWWRLQAAARVLVNDQTATE